MSFADSSGRSTLKAAAVLIFDLDGTILSVNSFHFWVLTMLIGRFGGLSYGERIVLSLRTIRTLVERKLFRKSHSAIRQYLQGAWMDALEKDAGQAALLRLHEGLRNRIRPNLRNVLDIVAEGKADAVLATAAAGVYAEGFALSLGFRHILTTDGLSENSGEKKRDRVLSLLADQGLQHRTRIFFTDHEDDLPLIRESHLVLWFGKYEDMQRIRKYALDVEIIPCAHLPGNEIIRLLEI